MNNSYSKDNHEVLYAVTKTVFDHMQEGVMILDSNFNLLFVNHWGEKVIGFEMEELFQKPYSALFYDQSKFELIKIELMKDRCWSGEVLKKRKNGNTYSEWVNIQLLPNANDEMKQYVIIFRDLSIQKTSQFERSFSAKVLEHTSEGVMVTDEKGSIVTVNPAFEIVTGYLKGEVIGENPRVFKSGMHDQEFYKKMWREVYENGSWKGEIWNKRKNGEVYPEWISISSIKDSSDNITNFVAVFSDITERKHAEEQLRKLAHFDALTGVANRYSLNQRFESLLNTSKKYDQHLAVLFLDLDRFKQINDTLGHRYGDLLLKEVSIRIKGMLKNKDLISRLGGDEFVIVLPNIKHPKEAVYIAERIIRSLKSPFFLEDNEVYISTSIGISLFPFDGDCIDDLLRTADKAMYQAKFSGRNQYELYHSDMHQNVSEQLKLEIYLRKALERKELYLVYHPQLDLQTKRVVGLEVLLRWNQKELGNITPNEFIPIAEETGLIIPISEWIIQKACEDLSKIHVSGYPHIRMCINISAMHFNQDNFVKSVEELIRHANVAPSAVELELTESMIMPNAPETILKLVKLKQAGLKLSVDDFGTGYSSLSYLNRFPLDTLKIDKSFIDKIGMYHDDSSIVEMIITLAHKLQLRVVAEGVEHRKQMQFLMKEKCDLVQGFYITQPLKLDELIDFLKDWKVEYMI